MTRTRHSHLTFARKEALAKGRLPVKLRRALPKFSPLSYKEYLEDRYLKKMTSLPPSALETKIQLITLPSDQRANNYPDLNGDGNAPLPADMSVDMVRYAVVAPFYAEETLSITPDHLQNRTCKDSSLQRFKPAPPGHKSRLLTRRRWQSLAEEDHQDTPATPGGNTHN